MIGKAVTSRIILAIACSLFVGAGATGKLTSALCVRQVEDIGCGGGSPNVSQWCDGISSSNPDLCTGTAMKRCSGTDEWNKDYCVGTGNVNDGCKKTSTYDCGMQEEGICRVRNGKCEPDPSTFHATSPPTVCKVFYCTN
jgi:hypothetical protein